MNKILDNKKNKVSGALIENIEQGSKLSITSAYFTIYAYDKLKKALGKIKGLRFLFLEPTFTEEKEELREFYINKLSREKQLSGTEYEIKLRNELTQSQIAKECAEWIENEAVIKSKTGFKDTLIWNKLYKFQKDAVWGRRMPLAYSQAELKIMDENLKYKIANHQLILF